MDEKLARRTFLKHLAAATVALPATTAWSQYKPSKNPFALGVASGSPTHSSVVLWTRLYDEGVFSSNLPDVDIPVKWEISPNKDFKSISYSGVSNAVAGLAHSVHVDVNNLPSNTWFYYRFLVGEHTSPVGQTRTFADPASNEEATLKLAFASCQDFERGYFNSYPHLIAEKPDLVIFLGDYIYEFAPRRSSIRSHTGSWCISLSDYRKRHAQYKQELELQQAHAACPWIFTWDDHEVQNDYAGVTQGSIGPQADFQKRRASAYQAYYEHMPLKASCMVEGLSGLSKGSELRIYDRYQFGKLASISMLDTRQYRSNQVCTPGEQPGSAYIFPSSCPELLNESRSLLGNHQEQWLDKELGNSKNQIWNVIAQSTLFGQRIVNTSGGKPQRVWNDGWDGYPISRKKILEKVKTANVKNFVVIGGDVHEYWVGYVKDDYTNKLSEVLGFEFCGTSITSLNSGNDTVARHKPNPHYVFSEGLRRGYSLVEITPESLTVHLRSVKSVETKTSDIETLASFRVLNGSKKLERL